MPANDSRIDQIISHYRIVEKLGGGPPRQVTDFTSGHIFDFSWSRDGKQLLLAKGEQTSDVVLVSNFR